MSCGIRLGLDAGYLSRMVKALEGQGLVRWGCMVGTAGYGWRR